MQNHSHDYKNKTIIQNLVRNLKFIDTHNCLLHEHLSADQGNAGIRLKYKVIYRVMW